MVHERVKVGMFIKGHKVSQTVTDVLSDLVRSSTEFLY